MEKATSSLTQKGKPTSVILLDATTYFEQAAALASISTNKALSVRVLDFGSAKLLASSAFASTPLRERLVITRSTLALYAPIGQTAQASLRVSLARRFDKLADVGVLSSSLRAPSLRLYSFAITMCVIGGMQRACVSLT